MAINQKQSYSEYVVSTPQGDFAIGFEDYNQGEKDRINVTVDGKDAVSEGYTVLRKNALTIAMEPFVPSGIVRLARETNIDSTFYKFTAGAVFDAANVDSNFQQILHSQQEVKDRQSYVEGQVLPLVDGLEDALEKADAASKAAIEAAKAAEEAAQQTRMAENVIDISGLTQQDLNSGIPSVAAMRLLNPKAKGERVYLVSWHEGLEMGGGVFVTTQKAGLVDNGGTIIASANPNIFYVRINQNIITPIMFGAKGDSTYDDRPAFQSAIDFLWNNRGGELYVPKPAIEYRWKSYDATQSTCLYIPAPQRSPYVDPICIRGEGDLVLIKVDLSATTPAGIKSAVKFGGQGLYKRMENLSIWGGVSPTVPYVDYVLHAADNYSPNLTLRNLQLYVAKKDCLRLATFVSVLEKVQTAYSPRGIVVDKPEGSGSAPCTSINFISCYALNHTEFGFWCGELTYSHFTSCASDHIINPTGAVEAYPYYIDIARGVTFTACGAESSTRILRVRAAQGLVINGIMTLSIGKVETGQPRSNRLIRIDSGWSTTIAGVYNHNIIGFDYVLSVGQAFGAEAVTVLDASIKSTESTWVSNYGYENPIRFLREDYTQKTHDLPLTNTGNGVTNATNMQNWCKLNYGREYLHDLIIRLPSGDFPISAKVSTVDKFNRGHGRIRFIGHVDGTSRIVVTGDGGINMGSSGKLAPTYLTVENATIHIGAMNGTVKGFDLYNAELSLVNAKITSDNGARQFAMDRLSKIYIDANSSIATNSFGEGTLEFTYKGTAAPTNTKMPVGTRFWASDPNATRIGWMNITANSVNWLTLTP